MDEYDARATLDKSSSPARIILIWFDLFLIDK